MSVRGAKVLAWKPRGICDTLDSTMTGVGSMSVLSNLIQDPSTAFLYRCRAAAYPFALGATAPVPAPTVMLVIGDILFGMYSNIGGNDYPFATNLVTGATIFVSGITNANTPTTQSMLGDWSPPTMDQVGQYILVTHPGFNGSGNGYFGWMDISTITAPVWNSGNTSIQPLPSPPSFVKVFGGRAYYAVGNAVCASDVLLPLQRTNAGQVLTIDDITPITALAGFPFNNTVTGGVLQALLAFKAEGLIVQITGDYSGTPSPWTINTISTSTGTRAPNSIVSTPTGIYFLASDGFRMMDFTGVIHEPVGEYGQGIVVPFQESPTPSRICAAYNMDLIRIGVRTPNDVPESAVEYWYNISTDSWTGPHSLPTSFLVPYSDQFLAAITPPGAPNQLGVYKSDVIPKSVDTFTEFGSPMAFTYTTSLLPDSQNNSKNSLGVTSIFLGVQVPPPLPTARFVADQTASFTTVPLAPSPTPAFWGTAIWGSSLWGGGYNFLGSLIIPWQNTIAFRQGEFSIYGQSNDGLQIGTTYFEYQVLNYLEVWPGGFPGPQSPGIWNDGGVVALFPDAAGLFPTTPAGLLPGAIWNNGYTLVIVPGSVVGTGVPSPFEVFFNYTSATALAGMNAGNFPVSPTGLPTGQLYNNGGLLCIAP